MTVLTKIASSAVSLLIIASAALAYWRLHWKRDVTKMSGWDRLFDTIGVILEVSFGAAAIINIITTNTLGATALDLVMQILSGK